MYFIKPDEHLFAKIEEKQKVSFTPEIVICESHIPVIKARPLHRKLSNFQRKGEENELLDDKFMKTLGNLKVHYKNDDSQENFMNNKMALSEVYEPNETKEIKQVLLSPDYKKKPHDFSLKAMNFAIKSPSSVNSLGNRPIFKRKSTMLHKTSPENSNSLGIFNEIKAHIPKNKRTFMVLPPEMIKIIKKEEILEKIQKKNQENYSNNFEKVFCKSETQKNSFEKMAPDIIINKKQNHAKSKLTEAFQKAEIYNDQVVRQINFEKENEEEEKNFQELFDALKDIN